MAGHGNLNCLFAHLEIEQKKIGAFEMAAGGVAKCPLRGAIVIQQELLIYAARRFVCQCMLLICAFVHSRFLQLRFVQLGFVQLKFAQLRFVQLRFVHSDLCNSEMYN